MNHQNEIEKLKRLKSLIKKSLRNQRKLLLIDDFNYLTDYLELLEIIDRDFYNSIGDDNIYYLEKVIDVIAYKSQKEFIDNLDLIDNITCEYKNLFNKYPLELLPRKKFDSKNIKDLKKLFEEFLNYLGTDVYSLYYKMMIKEDIIITDKLDEQDEGFSFDTSRIDNPKIILKNRKNFYAFVLTLTHELGHCYEFVRNKTNYQVNRYTLLTEITSILFEKLFHNYILERGYYSEYAIIENMRWQYNIKEYNNSNLVTNKALKDGKYQFDEIDFGKIILDNTFSMECFPFDLQFSYECCPSHFMNYKYVLSEQVASFLFKLYLNNKEKALLEIKNFITTIHLYSLEEILIKYGFDFSQKEEELEHLAFYQKKKFYIFP